jgi:hypothetical protein
MTTVVVLPLGLASDDPLPPQIWDGTGAEAAAIRLSDRRKRKKKCKLICVLGVELLSQHHIASFPPSSMHPTPGMTHAASSFS